MVALRLSSDVYQFRLSMEARSKVYCTTTVARSIARLARLVDFVSHSGSARFSIGAHGHNP